MERGKKGQLLPDVEKLLENLLVEKCASRNAKCEIKQTLGGGEFSNKIETLSTHNFRCLKFTVSDRKLHFPLIFKSRR